MARAERGNLIASVPRCVLFYLAYARCLCVLHTKSYMMQAEIINIQHSLRELNSNIGHLVTLVGQQTQFFLTMQACGFHQCHGSNSDNAAPPTAHRLTNVDPASIAKLRQQVAQDPKPTELPMSHDSDCNTLLVCGLHCSWD